MAGKTFHEILKKGTQMRCLDYYGRHPERDGPILVGILIGKFARSKLTRHAFKFLWKNL